MTIQKKIRHFRNTYFYYNSTEKKGIYILLAIIFLSLLASKAFFYFIPKTPLSYQHIQFPEENLMKDSLGHQKQQLASAMHSNHSLVQPKPKIAKRVELNTADSATLVGLYRIGPVLAGKIVGYRTKLGGYYSLNQLKEIWGFDEDILYDLQEVLWLEPNTYRRFDLNEVMEDSLKVHPYFKFKLSQALVNYRTQHGPFNKLEDLKAIKLVNDSILRLIKPYIKNLK